MIPTEEYARDEKAELRQALYDMLDSVGWRQVARPALERRLMLARIRLEDGNQMTLDQVRGVQAEIRVLREMCERPKEAFTP